MSNHTGPVEMPQTSMSPNEPVRETDQNDQQYEQPHQPPPLTPLTPLTPPTRTYSIEWQEWSRWLRNQLVHAGYASEMRSTISYDWMALEEDVATLGLRLTRDTVYSYLRRGAFPTVPNAYALAKLLGLRPATVLHRAYRLTPMQYARIMGWDGAKLTTYEDYQERLTYLVDLPPQVADPIRQSWEGDYLLTCELRDELGLSDEGLRDLANDLNDELMKERIRREVINDHTPISYRVPLGEEEGWGAGPDEALPERYRGPQGAQRDSRGNRFYQPGPTAPVRRRNQKTNMPDKA